MNFEGKVVFITGGSSGYGRAMAKKFTNEGATVIIAARNEEELIKAKNENVCQEYLKMDVTNSNNWEDAKKYVEENYGRIDILINNAGGGVAVVDTVDQTFENIDKSISLNLNSVIYGSKVFGEMMKAQKSGTIINISSVCAKEAWPKFSVYAAAKWGVLGFSKGLYTELQPYGVRVTCVIPASAATKFSSSAGLLETEHMLQTEDIAQAIYDICSLPEHVFVEETTIWGIDQVVNPL